MATRICPLCVWYGSLRGLETHVRGHFKKGPVACLVCESKDIPPCDSYDLWTQKSMAGTKRKRSRCHEMEFKLDFGEPTAPEPDRKRARVSVCFDGVPEVPAAGHEAQVCYEDRRLDDAKADDAEYDFIDDGDDESLGLSSCESLSASGSATPPTTRQCSPRLNVAFEPICWDGGGSFDDPVLSCDLDDLLKDDLQHEPLAGKGGGGWMDLLVEPDASVAQYDPKDCQWFQGRVNGSGSRLPLNLMMTVGFESRRAGTSS
ncbi:hypothetical protein MFIFM68171_02205 [Madurella fahalii]|uniref:C2H2-type domain-containing protein n=1 Tax=Madurella fahalii TaxID=1157608 RepID=A0ABQ0G2N5_9PEZI